MNKPTSQQLRDAVGQTMPDLLAPGLRVLFCGINPSVYSAVVGHHFARPGNRFWPALHNAGWTPRRLRPDEDAQLLELGLGLTNVASRATVAAADLTNDELRADAPVLLAKIERYYPRWLAVLGVGAYRVAFAEPKAQIGRQTRVLGATKIWVLPNPSGLNAHYPPSALAEKFREFREAVNAETEAEAEAEAEAEKRKSA